MLKKVSIGLLAALVVAVPLVGCGRSDNTVVDTIVIEEFTEGFEKAEFSKFNSFASENGLEGTKIYIEGTLNKTEILEADGTQSIMGYIIDDSGNNWIIHMHTVPIVAENHYDSAVGKKVVLTAAYSGYSGVKKMPAAILDELLIVESNETYYGMQKLLEYEEPDVIDTSSSEETVSSETTSSEISSKSETKKPAQTDEDFEYEVLSDGTISITKYKGSSDTVTIWSKFDGYEVSKIGKNAFKNCTTMESITIWPDVTEIGDSAFEGCTGLTSISISSDTKIIGKAAFKGCKKLETVILWGGEKIGESAFENCTALESISIPSEVTSIGASAFKGCKNLETVIIWNDNVKIGKNAFANCPKLDDPPGEIDTSDNSSSKDTSSKNVASEDEPKKEETTKSESKETIHTVKNNSELKAVLNWNSMDDSIIKSFASKYEGETIEFDGNVAAMNNHGSYTTRFDILVYAGDFSTTSVRGPAFQFRDVGASDLDIETLWLEEELGVGDNIHVVAKVGKYNESTQLFQLKPVSVKVRS